VLAANPGNRHLRSITSLNCLRPHDYARASDFTPGCSPWTDASGSGGEAPEGPALAVESELQGEARLARLRDEKKWDEAPQALSPRAPNSGAKQRDREERSRSFDESGPYDEAREVLDRLRKSGRVDENLKRR